ncbi:hypothetical protein H8B15_18350 [Hymenobacter sp. BT507]|uniref:Lipoprotein n=1 Tax=Hymenobacter citatus TaxID=2763506 RepID=A0ABR7MP69_9BACT|nr:hypothetical protein [Hymenobacter citatus]MBC6612890.1 hypothetical protein [Hymenobacter citatus]
MTHHYPRLLSRVFVVSLLALAAVACTENNEETPAPENDYYPVRVGTYRTYAVTDSLWRDNVLTVQQFQFRERVAGSFTDASGQTAYNVIRSRRATATDAWQDDSTLVLLPTDRTLQQIRNNRRTVELVFPTRTGYSWNRDAYNSLDTVTAQNREYQQVGEAYTANGRTYERTVTTTDTELNTATGTTLDDGLYNVAKYRQVYAQGVGPVARVRRRFVYCGTGNCVPTKNNVYRGQVRRETLLESGNL